MKAMSCVVAFAALAVSVATAAEPPDRIFDIVPPQGRQVQWVDDLTVLRQAGTKYGAVLTFMPESETTAWIPIAVLNTSGAPLKVGTDGVSAAGGALKVWSTTGLIRLAKERRIAAPEAMTRSSGNASAVRGAPTANAADTIGPVQPGGVSQGQDKGGSKARRNNDQEREHDLAVAQVTALRERLFRNETIAPRTVGRGDVRIELPPRRADGMPAEFVLTLEFGGERMDVLYRERLPGSGPTGGAPAG